MLVYVSVSTRISLLTPIANGLQNPTESDHAFETTPHSQSIINLFNRNPEQGSGFRVLSFATLCCT